jgi:hypothetical protein
MDSFLGESQMKDSEKILADYFKALDFIVAEIYNLKIPFIDDPHDIR